MGYTFNEGDSDITTLTARMYIEDNEYDAEGELSYKWFYEDGTVIGTGKSIEVEVNNLGNHSVYFIATDEFNTATSSVLGLGVL